MIGKNTVVINKAAPFITQLIDDASCDLDLRSPPSNHFAKLRGNLAGKHAIRVNKQWRLVFTWSGERGEAQDIYLDNHDYR